MSRRYTPRYRRDELAGCNIERLPRRGALSPPVIVPNLPWRNWTDEEVDRAIAEGGRGGAESMREAAIWLCVGFVLFFGVGLKVSPFNFSPVVEIGVGAALGCFVWAFVEAATHPPGV